jgi:hypothetical protein
VPWDMLDADGARQDMLIYANGSSAKLRQARTFIFPRNAVRHTSVLSEFGIKAYRAARQRSICSTLIDTLNPWLATEGFLPKSNPQPLPAGYFVNWRFGKRRLIPTSWTIFQSLQLIRSCAQNSGVAHFWLHPENIVSSPSTLSILKAICIETSRLRDSGKIEVKTQLELVST